MYYHHHYIEMHFSQTKTESAMNEKENCQNMMKLDFLRLNCVRVALHFPIISYLSRYQQWTKENNLHLKQKVTGASKHLSGKQKL